jgi:hypothetical protein
MKHLEDLGELQHLVLEHTAITDACLGSLSKLRKLSHIYLTGTKVTEAVAQQLQGKLPKLQLIER